jgi:CheY-like chemotaxis protein
MAVMLGTPLPVRDLVFSRRYAQWQGPLTQRGGAGASLLFIARERLTMQVIGLVNLPIRCQSRRMRMSLLVLVVDDEPDVEVLFRQQFRRDLRADRFTMEFAQSAPMALQRITDAAGVSLILILSDINMPGMSGLELLPKAKALRPDVPVIMITAYGDVETKRKALENGAEALLTKPIDFVTLRNEIDMRVERAA